MVGRLLVGFVWLNRQFSVSGRQILVGFVWLNLVFCVMVGRLLVGFVWLNLQVSVSWQVDFQRGSCGSIFSFLCHGWQTFSGVRVAQSFVFCVMVGRLLVGFVWLNRQFSVSGRQILVGFVWLNLVFCVMVGRLLVGFVWLNLQVSVSWQVDFQRGSCGSIFSFLCHGWQTFSGVRVAQSLVLCHGRYIFIGVRVVQSLVFCVMLGRLLVGFVWLNLQFSMSWLVDFQWGSCGSIFSFLCHGWQTFSGVRVAQSLVFYVMVGRLLVGFVWLNLQFCVMVGRRLVGFVWLNLQFCVMIGRLLAGFVWLNLQFYVSWLIDFQWGSFGSIFSFLCHDWQTFSGVRVAQSLVFCVMARQTFSGVRVAQSLVFCVMVGRLLVGFVWLNLQFCVMIGRLLAGFLWLNLQFYVSWLIDFQWGSFGSIFSFLCHGWQTFSWVRVAQSLIFCVMVGRLLVGFVWLNLQFSVSWQVDFQWGSCDLIFNFLCHGWQTFSGVRVAQSLVFCVMAGRFLVGFVWLNLQFSVSWLVDFQSGSCGSIVSFLCHGWQTFSGVRVAQSLGFCVMVGRLLAGFVRLKLQFSVSWLVDFQQSSCGSIFSFVSWLVDFQWGSCGSIFCFLCHGWQTFSGVRVAQSLVFCVMVGRLLVGFVWLNLQFFVMVGRFLGGFVWLNLQFSVSWLLDFQGGSCGSIFSFLCHGWQIFSGVRVAQSLVFCVMVGRLLVGLVWLNLQFCVMVGIFLVGFVWLNLQFCVMIGIFLVGFVWLNLQFSVSWLVGFQWGSCGSFFSFLCHGWQTFSGVRVAQSLVFCVMVGRLLVGFVWLNRQFSVSWLIDFQWGSCGSIQFSVS